MRNLQFSDYKNVDIGRFTPVFEVQGNGFLNIPEKLVSRISLRENIFADAASAPSIPILVNFHFHEHSEDLDKHPTTILIDLDSWFLKFVEFLPDEPLHPHFPGLGLYRFIARAFRFSRFLGAIVAGPQAAILLQDSHNS